MSLSGGSSHGLVIRIHDLRAASRGLKSWKSWWQEGLNSLLSSNKVSLLSREQTPQPCTGNIGSINSTTPYREYWEYKQDKKISVDSPYGNLGSLPGHGVLLGHCETKEMSLSGTCIERHGEDMLLNPLRAAKLEPRSHMGSRGLATRTLRGHFSENPRLFSGAVRVGNYTRSL